jgi:antirestriction protein
MIMDEITNSDKFINSADVVERITELSRMTSREDWEEDELARLRDLHDQLTGIFSENALRVNNPTLVRENDFENYARTTADDIGDIREEGSVSGFVDWESYAANVRVDWTSVDFDGTEYLVRG